MRHRPIRLMTMLLALLLLVGCGIDRTGESGETTTGATTTAAATTEPTTVPTEPTEPPVMDAESIYWKVRYAAMNKRANQYTLSETIKMRYGADGIYFKIEADTSSTIMLSLDPYAINLKNRTFVGMMGMEVDQKIQTYYRLENDTLVQYLYLESADHAQRMEIEDTGISNYEFFQSFNTIAFPGYLPEDLTVDEEKHTIGGRPAYALRYTDSARNVFQLTSDASTNAKLAKIAVPVVWYVDAEDFKPLQRELLFDSVGDELGQVIAEMYGEMLGVGGEEMSVEISAYSQTVTDLIFDDVEVPAIPEEVIAKAKESGGYSEV